MDNHVINQTDITNFFVVFTGSQFNYKRHIERIRLLLNVYTYYKSE